MEKKAIKKQTPAAEEKKKISKLLLFACWNWRWGFRFYLTETEREFLEEEYKALTGVPSNSILKKNSCCYATYRDDIQRLEKLFGEAFYTAWPQINNTGLLPDWVIE
ncbi:MAG: hypothetical protein MdMp024_0028 [Bacteroidales bacterium]